jgi:pimeloyl-ACP methyl ester carboxylesterase
MTRKLLPIAYGCYFNLLSCVSPKRAAARAFKSFCKVRKGKVLPVQESFLQQAANGREQVMGHELQTYRWPGKGEAVLLVHGWESNSFRWLNLISHLKSEGYDIYAFDGPGHGYSTGKHLHVPLYAECVSHFVKKYKPKYLVGHSMGGITCLFALYRIPDEGVGKIVTIGAPSEFRGFLEYFRTLLNLNGRMMAALEHYVRERFGLGVSEFTSTRFAAALPQKGLLLHDKHDKVAPFRASEQVHAAWPGSTLVPTEGLGHSLHQDEVNKKIADFLKS